LEKDAHAGYSYHHDFLAGDKQIKRELAGKSDGRHFWAAECRFALRYYLTAPSGKLHCT